MIGETIMVLEDAKGFRKTITGKYSPIINYPVYKPINFTPDEPLSPNHIVQGTILKFYFKEWIVPWSAGLWVEVKDET